MPWPMFFTILAQVVIGAVVLFALISISVGTYRGLNHGDRHSGKKH